MGLLFSNLFCLSELIFDFGKWSNWKYANKRICVFVFVFVKSKTDFESRFEKKMPIFLF